MNSDYYGALCHWLGVKIWHRVLLIQSDCALILCRLVDQQKKGVKGSLLFYSVCTCGVWILYNEGESHGKVFEERETSRSNVLTGGLCVEWMCVIVFLAVRMSLQSRFIYSMDGPYHVFSCRFNSILTKKINAYTLFMSVTLCFIHHSHSCQECLLILYTFEHSLFSILSFWSSGIHVEGQLCFRGCRIKVSIFFALKCYSQEF